MGFVPKLLNEDFVKNRIVEWLGQQGYFATHLRMLSEHGADIAARRRQGSNYFVIEVKGEPNQKFYYGFLTSAIGEIVQHMTNKLHCRYAIALPVSFETIVKRRIPSVAARKIGLEVLLVDSKGKVERLTWKDLKGSTSI